MIGCLFVHEKSWDNRLITIKMKILFVNGVNTFFGGSGASAVRCWLGSLARFNFDVTEINIHPHIPRIANRRIINLVWALYFLPGSIARIIGSPLMEPFYKISPLLAARILKRMCNSKWDLVIFSHYAVILYSLFVPRLKRVFIIQDLLYRRAKSLGFPAFFCKKMFWFELKMYELSNCLCALSYQEQRILQKFVKCKVHLVGCYEITEREVSVCESNEEQFVAVVSDWRRKENKHGLQKYLAISQVQHGDAQKMVDPFIELRLFGYGSDSFSKTIQRKIGGQDIKVTCGGLFKSYSEIKTSLFLVPIYHGAGIKLKTVEALFNGKRVIGTKGAFHGLPIKCISGMVAVTENSHDLYGNLNRLNLNTRTEFPVLYGQCFQEIGKVLKEFIRQYFDNDGELKNI